MFERNSISESASHPTQYVYHMATNNFIGTWIVPLNKMPSMDNFENSYKQIYDAEKMKYKGREELMNIVIPTLNNCLWNDVIFMSNVHPHLIYAEFQKLGLPVSEFADYNFFKIPAYKLKEQTAAVWEWPEGASDDPKQLFPSDSFKTFDPKTYKELTELPGSTIKHYAKEAKENASARPRFLFFGIPHVMTTELIEVSDIEKINWRNP